MNAFNIPKHTKKIAGCVIFKKPQIQPISYPCGPNKGAKPNKGARSQKIGKTGSSLCYWKTKTPSSCFFNSSISDWKRSFETCSRFSDLNSFNVARRLESISRWVVEESPEFPMWRSVRDLHPRRCLIPALSTGVSRIFKTLRLCMFETNSIPLSETMENLNDKLVTSLSLLSKYMLSSVRLLRLKSRWIDERFLKSGTTERNFWSLSSCLGVNEIR